MPKDKYTYPTGIKPTPLHAIVDSIGLFMQSVSKQIIIDSLNYWFS